MEHTSLLQLPRGAAARSELLPRQWPLCSPTDPRQAVGGWSPTDGVRRPRAPQDREARNSPSHRSTNQEERKTETTKRRPVHDPPHPTHQLAQPCSREPRKAWRLGTPTTTHSVVPLSPSLDHKNPTTLQHTPHEHSHHIVNNHQAGGRARPTSAARRHR